MKKLTLFLLLALQSRAWAAADLRFLPLDRNAIVFVRGTTDSDFSNLYELMNVPEQDTQMGIGKGLKSPTKDFNMVCSRDKTHCQFVLNKSENVTILSAKKYMSYQIQGQLADEMSALFKLDANKEFYFESSDKLMRFFGKPQSFVFEASQNGFSD